MNKNPVTELQSTGSGTALEVRSSAAAPDFSTRKGSLWARVGDGLKIALQHVKMRKTTKTMIAMSRKTLPKLMDLSERT